MSSLLDIEQDVGDSFDHNDLLSFTDDVLLSDYMDVEEFGKNIISEYDNENHLKLMHLNIDNLTTKFDAFSTLITQQLRGSNSPFFDIIAVSESHLRSEKSSSNQCSLSEEEIKLSLDGYGFHGKSRVRTKKGGVGLFVRNELYDQFSVDEELSIFHEGIFESIFLRNRSRTRKDLVVGTIYLPNGLRSNKSQILEIFENICEQIQRSDCECILMGDMNVDMMRYMHDETVSEYIDLIVSNGLKFRLAQPTRVTHTSATLIDHMIDNFTNETKACGVITTQLQGSSGYTDHFPIYSIVQRMTQRPSRQSTFTKRKITAATKKGFQDNLKSADFTSAYQDNVNDAMSNFTSIIQAEYNKSFPLITQKVKQYDHKDKDSWPSQVLQSP